MGWSYSLMCRDCGVSMGLGQIYWQSPTGAPLDDATFFGIYYGKDRQVHKRDEVFGHAIEKFLILHRNHQLLFAPDGVEELLEPQMPRGPLVDADEMIDTPVDPLPNPAEEFNAWKLKVGKNLE